jgi:peptidoglycan hydrolase-like protein with peptidoglycan-binding domain
MTVTTSNQINKPVVKKGSTGEAVKELQKLLLDYGMYVYINNDGACYYPGVEVIDGVFGSKTENAVILFQGKMFLVQDGVVGNKTWRSLYKGAPVDMPVLKKGSTGALVKQMQERLSTGGYYDVVIDGIFGSQTELAVRNLQQHTGLLVDGIVGVRTWFEISKIQTIFC